MRTITTLLLLAFIGSTASQAVNFTTQIDENLLITIPSCQKQATDVTCNATVVAKNQDIHTLATKVSFLLISPNGDEVQASEYTVKGEDGFNGFDYRQDIVYPAVIRFKNYPSSSIKYMDVHGYYGSHRLENIPLVGPPVAVPNNKIIVKSPLLTNMGKYNVNLSNCQSNASGILNCSVSLTPIK